MSWPASFLDIGAGLLCKALCGLSALYTLKSDPPKKTEWFSLLFVSLILKYVHFLELWVTSFTRIPPRDGQQAAWGFTQNDSMCLQEPLPTTANIDPNV